MPEIITRTRDFCFSVRHSIIPAISHMQIRVNNVDEKRITWDKSKPVYRPQSPWPRTSRHSGVVQDWVQNDINSPIFFVRPYFSSPFNPEAALYLDSVRNGPNGVLYVARIGPRLGKPPLTGNKNYDFAPKRHTLPRSRVHRAGHVGYCPRHRGTGFTAGRSRSNIHVCAPVR